MTLKSAILGSLTALLMGSCYPYQGRYFDKTAQAEAFYEDILPEQTNGKDFYTLYCWDVLPERKEIRFNTPELVNNDPAYQKMPFYNVTFQDTSGRPCRLFAFAKKEEKAEKEKYTVLFTHVPPQGQRYWLYCDAKPLPANPAPYSATAFKDSADNRCAFIFKERNSFQKNKDEHK